jgi:CRP/FNR family transcriptional regulator, nitrogen fixation regulation protein
MPMSALPQAFAGLPIEARIAKGSPRHDDRAGPIELMGARMTFQRSAEIYGEGEPADYLYKVVSGVVRTCKVTADGRRQIGGFYLPGDIFGLEAGETHAYSAEAISEAAVLVVKRKPLMALAARDGDVARQLWASTAVELSRAQGRLGLLVKSAQERVAGFLLEMAERSPGHASPGQAGIELPMTRQDIGEYLGLTIETVSRTLTSMQETALIELATTRRVVLRNRSALEQLGH